MQLKCVLKANALIKLLFLEINLKTYLQKVVMRIDHLQHVVHRNDCLCGRIDCMEKQITPVHSDASHLIDMISDLVDNDAMMCCISQLTDDLVLLLIHFGRWPRQNDANQLVGIENPNLQGIIY